MDVVTSGLKNVEIGAEKSGIRSQQYNKTQDHKCEKL